LCEREEKKKKKIERFSLSITGQTTTSKSPYEKELVEESKHEFLQFV
jgi:hypothetical protein